MLQRRQIFLRELELLSMWVGTADQSRTDVEFHAERAGTYDRDVADEYAVYDALVLDRVLDDVSASNPRAVTLDVGCGTGAVTVRLARRGFQLAAFDHSPQMIEVARAKLEAEGLADRVEFKVGEITELPYPDDFFDFATCQRVLHHIPEAGDAIREIRRVVKPGGTFYLSDVVTDTSPAFDFARNLWRRVARRPSSVSEVDEFLVEHEWHRTADEMLLLLDHGGFVARDVTFYNHLGLRDLLPKAVRRVAIQALSYPWRHRSGDVLFVVATKQ